MSERAYRAYNIAEVERRRDTIFERVLAGFVDTAPVGPAFERLVRLMKRSLPSAVPYDAVFESVRSVTGRPISRRLAYNLAWRLAGNLHRLKQGEVITPWTAQLADEWVPLQVLSAMPARNRRGDYGTEFGFLALAGSPCPLQLRHFWRNSVARLAARVSGFSRNTGKYPFAKPEELVGLRLYGHVIAARSVQAPSFYEMDCPESLRRWNRLNVLNLRFRIGKTCPNGWTHACHRCAVGYESCPAGTHYRTYQRGCCDLCGKQDAIFDVELSNIHCRECATRMRLQGAGNG